MYIREERVESVRDEGGGGWSTAGNAIPLRYESVVVLSFISSAITSLGHSLPALVPFQVSSI